MALWRRKVERARRLYGYVQDAAYVDDDGNYPKEWEDQPYFHQRLRIAMDARKSKRNVPAYIEHLGRIVEFDERRSANQKQPLQLNVGAINIVQAPKYQEIDVEAIPVTPMLSEVKKS